ncbi:MAG: hypothetical protein ACRDRY_08280 [Pseudonocardiaceae bacterium]
MIITASTSLVGLVDGLTADKEIDPDLAGRARAPGGSPSTE